MMVDPLSNRTERGVMTVDELFELVRSLGERNGGNERHVLTSLRLPAPPLAKDELESVRREARIAGLDCYVDREWLVLEPDAAALAEQDFFELRDQVRATRARIAAASWLQRLQERGAVWGARLGLPMSSAQNMRRR
jgi:hypothetical protein